MTNGQEVPSTDGGLNEYYMALYEYTSRESGDLNFIQGEVILVVKKDGDWWTGVIGNRTGIFPSNYVDKCDMPITVSVKQKKMCEFSCLFPFFIVLVSFCELTIVQKLNSG